MEDIYEDILLPDNGDRKGKAHLWVHGVYLCPICLASGGRRKAERCPETMGKFNRQKNWKKYRKTRYKA